MIRVVKPRDFVTIVDMRGRVINLIKRSKLTITKKFPDLEVH